jgi:1,2-diacylglycerol 3-alpha-glucosyltransferase
VRVLFVSDVYFPRVNGVSTSVRTFRQDLAACDVETVLVAPDYGPAATEAEANVVRVAAAGVPGDPEDRRMRWGMRGAHACGSCARGFRPRAHPHAFHCPLRGSARRTPSQYSVHRDLSHLLRRISAPLRSGPAARRFARSQCRNVAALVAPSEPMRAALVAYGVKTPIHIIPTGLAPDRFRDGDGARFRAAQALPAARPLLLYIGRVAHEKNIDFLVRVFAQVRASVPDALFVIAGEGPARASLRALVSALGLQEGVRFVGYLDRDTALLDCYAAADVFVFASRTETQGLMLLEAMAQGAPVVSTAQLGTRSILKEGCGALIVDEELHEFATAAVRVLQDRPLAATLARQGRSYARGWSSLAMARRLAELYRATSPLADVSAGARLNTLLPGGV